jgi:hypothetical protein
MQRFRRMSLMIAAPALAAMLSIAGCSSDKSDQPAAKKSDAGSAVGAARKTAKGGETKEPLVAKGWGALKGKVTFDGDPPAVKQISIPDSVKEKDQCLQGDTREQLWKVGPDKGVGDVMVWLRAPKGKYFQVPPDLQKADPAMVKLDQPNCSFIPHVLTLYPSYYDSESKKQKPTGQTFEVVNSANFSHNTNWKGNDDLVIPGANVLISAKTGQQKIDVRTSSKDKDVGMEQQIRFNCNIHQWMSAFARVFDHPFTAVTSGDAKDAKDFGNFEIKKVPAGVDAELVYWHESMKEPKVLKTVNLKEGENTENFSIK